MRIVLDVECYVNYFLIRFRNLEGDKIAYYERFEDEQGNVLIELDCKKVNTIMRKRETITFNGNNYDLLITSLAIQGYSCSFMKEISDAIIVKKMRSWEIEEQYNIRFFKFNSIDLIELAKGQASLKMYGARLNTRKIQDLPIAPESVIKDCERAPMIEYCGNDLQVTVELYYHLLPALELREALTAQYGIDLRSKSDAQIAEAVIKTELERLTKKKYYKPKFDRNKKFYYEAPHFVKFVSPDLQKILKDVQSHAFELGEGGKPILPRALRDKDGDMYVWVHGNRYKMGMGGLHSCEESVTHYASDTIKLFDRDVRSFYPQIILNEMLFPAQLGKEFLRIIREILERRVAAKLSGDKIVNECLKIVLNGSFGKFGSMFSVLYSPELLIQTTLTGQLSLLMLIEDLGHHCIDVISANTDGIVIKCPVERRKSMLMVVSEWEKECNYETEEVEYSALYSRDVNNYIALKTNGDVKLKGAYANVAIDKNPNYHVCVDAAIAKIIHDVPPSYTVHDCMEVTKFIAVKKAAGGAHKDGEYLGKTVRWYRSTDTNTSINLITNDNKVGGSDCGMPMMELVDKIPDDLDYDFYIKEAYGILRDVGYYTKKPARPSIRRDRSLQLILDELVA